MNENSTKHEFVDLGLSVKWATTNIGANKPSEYGDHFAWGEVNTKDDYSWNSYKHGSSANDLVKYNHDDDKKVLEPSDDPAKANWGDPWRVPTKEEWEELCNTKNCTWEWTNLDGTPGCKVTSKKPGFEDKSIFLPAAGIFRAQKIVGRDESAYYWSATRNEPFPDRALCLYFIPNFIGIGNNGFRTGGFTIRAVQ